MYPLLGVIGRPKSYERFLIQADSCLHHDTYDDLDKIKCPTLVIGGDHDRIVGVNAAAELAERIPNSELFVYEGIGHRYFGTRFGFEMIDHGTERNVCHIDMIKCPYFSACTEHGCPELTTAFCNADDIAYGNMHANLSWDRKKTLGRGDDRCDFILRVVKQKT